MRLRECDSASWFKRAPKTGIYSLVLFIAAAIILAGNRSSAVYSLVVAVNAFGFFVGMFYLLSGRGVFALSFSSVLVINLQFVNQLKVHFYKDTLLFPDFSMMFDPANVGTLIHYPDAGLAFMGMFLFAVVTGIITWCALPRRQGYFPAIGGLGIVVISGVILMQNTDRYQQVWVGTLPGGTGVVSNLVMSGRQVHFVPPTFPAYSANDFKTRMAHRLPPLSPVIATGTPPDIVLLLQESTTAPHLYRLPSPALLPHFDMFGSGGNVKAHTPLRVQTFGGGTWLSEFAALTGLRSDDFGPLKSAVFYTVIDHVNDSLFKQMKTNGYYTVVLTPFNKSAYNAGHAYHMMGVDKIIQPQELGYPGRLQDNLWHISTGDMLKYVREIMSQETDKPLFIYALTMYEHGPYDAGHSDDFQLGSSLGHPSAGKFSHYIEKIKASDKALSSFFQFVDHRSKPTLFMYFGDHQPSIDWRNGYTTTLPDAMHLTQFSLRDNNNQEPVSDLGVVTDIAFLGGILLERAQLTVSPFWQANIAMRHLCQGRLNECEDKALLGSYRHYIYDDLAVASGD